MSEELNWTTRGHRSIAPGRDVHTPYRWVVDLPEDIASITDVTEEDLYKTAFVVSTGALFTLINLKPIVRFIATEGNTGDVGPMGPHGPQGEKGDTGNNGARGLKGDKGDKGDQGERGLDGGLGSLGATGPRGVPGEQGDVGPQGPKGDKGDKGDKGEDGAPGVAGAKGEAGTSVYDLWKDLPVNAGKSFEDFIEEEAGIQGEKGEKGDKGDKGDEGDGVAYRWVVATIAERNAIVVDADMLNNLALVKNDGRGHSRAYRLNAISGADKWVEDNSPVPAYEMPVVTTTGVLDYTKGQVFKVNGASNPTISITSGPMVGFASTLTLLIEGKGTVTFAADIDWVGNKAPELGDTYTLIMFMLIDGRKVGQFSHKK